MLDEYQISDRATTTLESHLARWTGWGTASLEFTCDKAPIAGTNLATREVVVNPDVTIRNPLKVLDLVTPFRLRQEGILTGTLLHEAAHARYTQWRGHAGQYPEQVLALATVLDEPRIEAYFRTEARENGAFGLGWTLLASAARHCPPTSLTHDAMSVMDCVNLWVLTAGRHHAFDTVSNAGRPSTSGTPSWVSRMDSVLVMALSAHASAHEEAYGEKVSWAAIKALLGTAVASEDHEGPTMLDLAQSILDALYPGVPPEERPSPPDPHGADEDEGEEGDGGDTGDALPEVVQDEMQAAAEAAEEGQQADIGDADKAEQDSTPVDAGDYSGPGEWRKPTPPEQKVREDARRFLRDLSAPTVVTTRPLRETPSASIDAAAYAAWKARGATSAPRFSRRTRKVVTPAPPVNVAVLKDVSGSMESL